MARSTPIQAATSDMVATMVNALELFENFKNAQTQRALAEAKLRMAPLQEQALQFELTKGQQGLANEQTRLGLLSRQQQIAEELGRGRLAVMAQANQARLQTKAPPGYRMTADGNLEAIPGGPADTKLQGALNQDTAALQSSQAGLDRLQIEAERLKKHPGLEKTTGLMSAVPLVGGIATIPGTDAANFKAGLDTLKSQTGLSVLQEMRNNSKTGGALGQVSDFENRMLQANLANLDRAQSEPEFRAALDKIITYTEGAKERLRAAYNLKHSGKQPASVAPAAPASIEDVLKKYQ